MLVLLVFYIFCSVSPYTIHLNITCDDYCLYIKEGEFIKKTLQQKDQSLWNFYNYDIDFSLEEPITVVVSDIGGLMGFRGNFGFDYFKIPINNYDPIWTYVNMNNAKMTQDSHCSLLL